MERDWAFPRGFLQERERDGLVRCPPRGRLCSQHTLTAGMPGWKSMIVSERMRIRRDWRGEGGRACQGLAAAEAWRLRSWIAYTRRSEGVSIEGPRRA